MEQTMHQRGRRLAGECRAHVRLLNCQGARQGRIVVLRWVTTAGVPELQAQLRVGASRQINVNNHCRVRQFRDMEAATSPLVGRLLGSSLHLYAGKAPR